MSEIGGLVPIRIWECGADYQALAAKEPWIAAPLTVYDISIDARREVTQADVDGMEKALSQFYREREAKDREIAELRADSAQNGRYLDGVEALTTRALAAKDARIAKLDTENAKLKDSRDFWKNASDQHLDFMNQEAEYRVIERQNAVEVIAAKDARIAELNTELTLLRAEPPKPDPKSEPKPVPAPNPFRDFPTDPRRMGPR